MTLATKQNFTIDQGADWFQPLRWLNSDDSIKDLAGYTARMQIRSALEAPTSLIDLTTENSRITLGLVEETLGVPAYNILLEIENSASEDLPAGSWFYDLELIGSSGDVTRLLYGRARVRRNVTR